MALNLNLDTILKLPLPKKLLILAGINIVIIGAIYWFLTGPKHEEIKQLDVKKTELVEKLDENRKIAADIPRYQKEKEEMEAKLRQAVAQLPNEKEIPDLIDAISEAAEKAGLKIQLFKPGREISRGFYADIPVNMTVEGRYESMYDFSVKISNLPRIVNLSGIDVRTIKLQKREPVLNANFVATTFRFVPTQGAPK